MTLLTMVLDHVYSTSYEFHTEEEASNPIYIVAHYHYKLSWHYYARGSTFLHGRRNR